MKTNKNVCVWTVGEYLCHVDEEELYAEGECGQSGTETQARKYINCPKCNKLVAVVDKRIEKREKFIKQLEEYEDMIEKDAYVNPYKIEEWFTKNRDIRWPDYEKLLERTSKIVEEALNY